MGTAVAGRGKCLPTLDFDKDGRGRPLKAGDLAANKWSNLGITISTSDRRKPAMIFDTFKPTGGDHDLATTDKGKVLIISEDGKSSNPDDNAGGGTIYYKFKNPVFIGSLGLLDLEEVGYITAYDSRNRKIINKRRMPTMRDGESKRITLNARNVKKLEVKLAGSGALTDLVFCGKPPPPVGKFADFVSRSELSLHLSCLSV